MEAFGNPLAVTPYLDRMAREQTFVANSFTCQPVCGPARSCLQTGRYATQTGVFRNGIALREDDVTMAKCFNEAGYHTGYIGKWHLADSQQVRPEQRGGYREWLAANATESCSDDFNCILYDEAGEAVKLPGYRVDAQTDAAIRFVDEHQDEPFFLFLSYLEPHFQNHRDDYPAPWGYQQKYQSKWIPPDLAALVGSTHQHLGGYWGMVKRLDEAYGRLLEALHSLGLFENTVVLFTSDHGCHFKTRNGEYKRSCHESSIRVPTVLTGPGFKGGGMVHELVNLVDLPPTLLDAAGIDVPDTMEGRSLLPLIRDPRNTEWPDDVFVQISEAETGRCIRTKRWKYSVTAEKDGKRGDADRYTEAFLYDLYADPYELENRIELDSHSAVRARMRERLLKHIKEVEGKEPEIVEVETRPGGQKRVSVEEVGM